jgi:hypothetical protein
MRSRLIGLGVLAVLLAAAAVGDAYATAQLQYAGQVLGSSGALNAAQLASEQSLFVLSFALQTVVAPLATASLLSAAAILAVLARRTQLRRRALAR